MRIIGIDISKRGCFIAIAVIVYLLLAMLFSMLHLHLMPSPGSKVSASSPKPEPSLIAKVVGVFLLTYYAAGIYSVLLVRMMMGGRGGCLVFMVMCTCVYGVIYGIRNSNFPIAYMCSLLAVAYVATLIITAIRD